MKLLDRYIIKHCVLSFIYASLFFLFIVCVVDLFENLEAFLKHRVPLLVLVRYYLFLAPTYFPHISASAILFATVYFLGYLSRHNELIVLQACGISVSRVIAPLLFVGCLSAATIFLFNERGLPYCTFQYQLIQEKYMTPEGKKGALFRKNIAALSGGYSYFIKQYNVEHKEMQGLTVLHYSKNKRMAGRIDAEKAKWTGMGWLISNGSIRRFDSDGKTHVDNFSERFIDFLETPAFFYKAHSIDMMHFSELAAHIKKLKFNGYDPLREEVHLYEKVAMPCMHVIILLIGVPTVLLLRKVGVWTGLSISLLITLVYKIAIILGIALGNSGALPPFIAAFFGNIIFLLLGFILLLCIRF